MREILFRAKRIENGEWVEGQYAYILNPLTESGEPIKHLICNGTNIFNDEIEPETLCQYTGLKDMNGNLIWENDIVEDKRFNGFYKIVFRVRDGGWYVENINSGALFRIIERTSCQYERCGNIFDNPELLKGGLTCRN